VLLRGCVCLPCAALCACLPADARVAVFRGAGKRTRRWRRRPRGRASRRLACAASCRRVAGCVAGYSASAAR